jgi:hypothetical protein
LWEKNKGILDQLSILDGTSYDMSGANKFRGLGWPIAFMVAAFIGCVALIRNLIYVHVPIQSPSCINNLVMIDAAKQQLALESSLTNGTPIEEQQLTAYLKPGIVPEVFKCPHGGRYTLNPIGKYPACSILKHKPLNWSQPQH